MLKLIYQADRKSEYEQCQYGHKQFKRAKYKTSCLLVGVFVSFTNTFNDCNNTLARRLT